MKCPTGTVEVSFWFPTTTDGGIYFDTKPDSHDIGQCVGFINSDSAPEKREMFDKIIVAVKPVLDLMTPKHKLETDYYTLTPEEFEILTEEIDYEMPNGDS